MKDTSESDWSKNGNVFDSHRKHFLIYVNQFQYITQEDIHSPRLFIDKKDQTKNCNLEVIFASLGYVKSVRVLPLVQF